MKRYNKQQVMNDAHRLYKNEFQRRGRSWSECLKAAWRIGSVPKNKFYPYCGET